MRLNLKKNASHMEWKPRIQKFSGNWNWQKQQKKAWYLPRITLPRHHETLPGSFPGGSRITMGSDFCRRVSHPYAGACRKVPLWESYFVMSTRFTEVYYPVSMISAALLDFLFLCCLALGCVWPLGTLVIWDNYGTVRVWSITIHIILV